MKVNLTLPFMQKKLSIIRHVAPYAVVFNKPLYRTFRALAEYFVEAKEQNLTDVSIKAGKSISAISYFFNQGKWEYKTLLEKMRKILKNRKETKPRKSDIACLDGSAITKHGKSFEDQTNVWDNSDKKAVKGYEFCGAAIVTKTGIKYLLDYLLYTKKEANAEGKFQIWIRLLDRLFETTKAWLFVLDAGFRNQYLLHHILKKSRHFLIRVLPTMKLLLSKKKGVSFSKVRRGRPKVYQMNGSKIRIWEKIGIVNAWKAEIKQTLRIVLIQRDGFKNPLILCTSDLESDAIEVYQNYCRRWKIEELFFESKEYFNLEGFRVRKLEAIHRYLCCVMVVHNILNLQLLKIRLIPELFQKLQDILKKYRKIPKLLIGGLKILYEMTAPPLIDLTLNKASP